MKAYNLSTLVNTIKSNSATVVLFGAGQVGKLALFALKKHGIQGTYFCDNDRNKQGKLFCSTKVITPQELSKLSPDVTIFICNDYITSVFSLLKEMHFTNIYDCLALLKNTNFPKDSFDGSVEVDPDLRTKPVDIKRVIGLYEGTVRRFNIDGGDLAIRAIDIVITERCSMKCRDCSNLMQYYVNPVDSDLELLFTSLDRLMKSIRGVFEFRVLGGEPFVNKNFHKVINKLVTYNVDNIIIYTNATIVPKNENLLCLKNSKVRFDISNYGQLSRNHDRLIETLKTNNIPFITRSVTSWTDCGTIKYRHKTESELTFMFKNCCVNDVLTVLNGKLYGCPFSANAINLKAIPFDGEDVIDLSDENIDVDTLRTKVEKLYTRKDTKQYLTACSHCSGRDYSSPKIDAAIQTRKPLPFDMVIN